MKNYLGFVAPIDVQSEGETVVAIEDSARL